MQSFKHWFKFGWMNQTKIISEALDEAANALGGKAELLQVLDVSPQAYSQWRTGAMKVSTLRAVQIEQLTGVSRSRLRPYDWEKQWPEIVKRESARAV